MCLIIEARAGQTFNHAWLEDFYESNQDGVGVMYMNGDKLEIVKELTNTSADFIRVFQATQGFDRYIHLRMKTHGKIDLANAHPYEVLNVEEHGVEMWMMHNGVLRDVSNDEPEMSDTWHFIRDEVRPLLAENPRLIFNRAFGEVLGKRIGSSNKLVFLNGAGESAIVNRNEGMLFQGCWLSNGYAWSSDQCRMEAPVEDRWGSFTGFNDRPRITGTRGGVATLTGFNDDPVTWPKGWSYDAEDEYLLAEGSNYNAHEEVFSYVIEPEELYEMSYNEMLDAACVEPEEFVNCIWNLLYSEEGETVIVDEQVQVEVQN